MASAFLTISGEGGVTLFPFMDGHLVEREDVNSFDGRDGGHVLRPFSEIVFVIGVAGNEHIAHPDRLLDFFEIVDEMQGRGQGPSCQTQVFIRGDMLNVE